MEVTTEKKSRSVTHLQIIEQTEESDEYGTPFYKFNFASKRYGMNPMIDVCASDINHTCAKYYTKEQDGLKFDWDLDFFMNPPYTKISEFMEHAWTQHKKHNVNGLILAYAHTGADWFQTWVEEKYDGLEVDRKFPRGRFKFLTADGRLSENVAPYYSCWILYRRVP